MAAEDPLVTGVDFVPIPTDDFDASFRFYGEVLGLPCIDRCGEMPGAEFQTGNVTLALMQTRPSGRSAPPTACRSRCTSPTSRPPRLAWKAKGSRSRPR